MVYINNFIRQIKSCLEFKAKDQIHLESNAKTQILFKFKAIKQVKILLRAKNQMNEITVLIYFICFAAVFGATFAFMWRMMTITLKDFDRVKTIHPELRDVKPGEELLVFKVKEEKD